MAEFDFIADLVYCSTEEGGRRTPAASGYRPHIMFEGYPEYLTSGVQYFINKELVYPGDIVKAGVKILGTEYFAGRLHEQLNFSFFEGSTKIGTGIITQIVNENLKISDINITAYINLNFYPSDTIKKIHQDFKVNAISVIQELQKFLIQEERFRNTNLINAIITLAEKDKSKVSKYIKLAKRDCNKVLSLAEAYCSTNKLSKSNNQDLNNE